MKQNELSPRNERSKILKRKQRFKMSDFLKTSWGLAERKGGAQGKRRRGALRAFPVGSLPASLTA